MATNGIDVQDVKRLNRQIEITAKYPIFCGGYADIFPGIWRSGPPFLGPGVWTGNATSGRNVAVAIKVLRMANHANNPRAQRKCAWDLEKECRVWALLRHPNVLPFFGLIDDPAIPSTGIVAPRCTFGNLRRFLYDYHSAGAPVNRLAIVKGIARGLTYVHEKKVVHGDLTMDNVFIEFINGNFTPLISDFGRSRVLETEAEGIWYFFESESIPSALHRHQPPEILGADDEKRTTKLLTQPADVWCFGMVMLETLTGEPPFFHMNEYQAVGAVSCRNEKPNQNRYPSFPHDKRCWGIMKRCWHFEPSLRVKMPGLLPSLNALR